MALPDSELTDISVLWREITARRVNGWNGKERLVSDAVQGTEKLLQVMTDETVWEPLRVTALASVVFEDNGYKTVSGPKRLRILRCGRRFPAGDGTQSRQLVTENRLTSWPTSLQSTPYVWRCPSTTASASVVFEGVKRHYSIFSINPLSRVHVFSQRLTIWRGDYIHSNTPVYTSGTTAYAWFVWDKDDDSGMTQVLWI